MDETIDPQSGEEFIRLSPEEVDQGKRVDSYLTEKIEDQSRTRIQEWIKQGRVRSTSGAITRTHHKVQAGEAIEIRLPPPLESAIIAEDLPIEVLYEDSDLAVVVKPSGMPTHPTTTKTTGTLVNALQYRLKNLSGVGGVLRPGIVHRLDRVTSGILVVAKNDVAHHSLTDQFKNRKVKKTYRALCLGHAADSKGVISGLIDRHPTKRQRMVLGESSGRESETFYEIVERNEPLYGLLLTPTTGRTHQLRVHLEKIHLPIVLDHLYGYEPKRWPHPALNPLLKNHPGIFLHAEKLEFRHPASGASLRFWVDPAKNFRKVWKAVFGASDF